MGSLATKLKSGSKLISGEKPIELIEIGSPGFPKQLVIYKGKVYVYNSTGDSLIDGGYVATKALAAGAVVASKIVFSNRKFVHNIVWTATDYNTASWAAGAIKFADGTSVSINAGNTGDITGKNYIYYDGTNTLKKTDNYATAVSGNNIPLAIVEPALATNGKSIVTSFASTGTTIDGDLVITGKVQSVSGRTYFDLNNNRFQISDPYNTRVVIGKMSDGSYGVKVSLPGYECDTDTNVNHYALWSISTDSNDYVLIKEKTRGSVSVDAGSHESVEHGLTYIPFTLVFVEESAGKYVKAHGWDINNSGPYYQLDSTYLTLGNESAGAKTFKYYIFYDEIA